jgi:predicted NAD/FAD-dependent oxidoreductase
MTTMMTAAPPPPVVVVPVVIVGAGVAGLSCAGMLAAAAGGVLVQDHDSSLWVLEADNRAGGRVWDRRGAELMHGTQTALTKYLGIDDDDDDDPSSPSLSSLLRPIYIVSHADGGPSSPPSAAEEESSSSSSSRLGGRYGQWYLDGQLYRANEHPDIMELRQVLDDYGGGAVHNNNNNNRESSCEDDDSTSAAATVSVLDILPPHLHRLAKVSFGNTAGCTDLRQISAHMLLRHFDTYWEENEEAGDYFLDADLVGLLLQDLPSPLTQLQLRHQVLSIALLDPDDETSPLVLDVLVSSAVATTTGGGETNGTTTTSRHYLRIMADAVVVTVPPHLWPTILHPSLLSDEKRQALQYVGMERPAIKIVCRYETPRWDPMLQQIICLDEPIPEIWFDGNTAVGFVMSEFAQQLLSTVAQDNNNNDTNHEAAMVQILTRQLAKILQVPVEQWVPVEYSGTIWADGAYMFPKVGLTPAHLEALAAPAAAGRVHFAGEATHTGACCTIQAAMETGYRAARSILSSSLSTCTSSS